jgi:hypothetical protein
MTMRLNPQYLVDDKGDKVSVLLTIEEYENIIEQLKEPNEETKQAIIDAQNGVNIEEVSIKQLKQEMQQCLN